MATWLPRYSCLLRANALHVLNWWAFLTWADENGLLGWRADIDGNKWVVLSYCSLNFLVYWCWLEMMNWITASFPLIVFGDFLPPFSILKTILHAAMKKWLGCWLEHWRFAMTFPQHTVKTKWVNQKNTAPVSLMVHHHVHQNDPNKLWSKGLVTSFWRRQRNACAAAATRCFRIHSFSLCQGIAYGDASAPQGLAYARSNIASPFKIQEVFWKRLRWKLKKVTTDPNMIQSCAKQRFPLPLPFPLPFPLPPLPRNEGDWERWHCSSDIKI